MVLETPSLWHGAYSQESQDLYDRIMELRTEGLKTPRGKTFTSPHVHSLIKKRRLRDERLNAEPTVSYQNSGLYFLERKHIKKWGV
jgi:hypothetical protein